jgi:hypothetical protein
MAHQNPQKELELNYNIDAIKFKIEEIVKVSGGNYQITDKNDAFHTYRIGIVSGITGGVIAITLTPKNDNLTLWKSEIMKMSGQNKNVDNSVTLSRLQDEFLSILGKGLSGETITKELFQQNRTGGCLGAILIGFTLTSTALYSLLA